MGSCGCVLVTKDTAIGVLSECGHTELLEEFSHSFFLPLPSLLTQLLSPTPVQKQVAAPHEHPMDLCSAPSMATPSVSPQDPVISTGVPAPQPLPRVTLSRPPPLPRSAPPALHMLQQMVEVTFVSE